MALWPSVAVLLLCAASGGCLEKANASNLIEFTAADFYHKLYSGKMMFMYFEREGNNLTKQNSFSLGCSSAILRDEVRYVHTDADLSAMEKSVKGKKDIVLCYVSSLGTREHRSIMETAFVYGSKYQFILITGGPVLKHLGLVTSSPSARVWVLHCTDHRSDRCPLTPMRKPVSTLGLHSFLQLMDAPLLTELHEDPSQIPPSQFPHQLVPQLFLFSLPETEALDKENANTLAGKLRGLAQVLGSVAVQTPQLYNAAYRLPGKVLAYFHRRKYFISCIIFCVHIFLSDQFDDEVAASVYLKRGMDLDMEVFTELNRQNFHSVVAQSSLTVALFYLKWDAASMAFLEAFVEVAESLLDGDVDDVQMCAVNCGEWTDLCAAESDPSDPPFPFRPITAFPTVLMLRPREPARRYGGMLTSQTLGRTPAGIDVLGSYLGSVPPLPSLILTHNPSAAEIYQYPPRLPISAPSVLQWVQRVEEGGETAAGALGDDNWPPVAPFYDFLGVMDHNDPSSARQQRPKQEKSEGETREGGGEDGGVNTSSNATDIISSDAPI
uniref:Thioredoxin domain containing 16 n=1 Tax=Periophthalmus magnuspinnatus TaxID=409849 RepID=A0A3B4BH97_9GOBI